jgi:hypothetical protein
MPRLAEVAARVRRPRAEADVVADVVAPSLSLLPRLVFPITRKPTA